MWTVMECSGWDVYVWGTHNGLSDDQWGAGDKIAIWDACWDWDSERSGNTYDDLLTNSFIGFQRHI